MTWVSWVYDIENPVSCNFAAVTANVQAVCSDQAQIFFFRNIVITYIHRIKIITNN